MRIAPSVVFCLASLGLAACGPKPAPAPAPAPPPPSGPSISYAEMPPTKNYPLKKCVVTGNELAATGRPPYVIAYKGYEVQFCSKDCVKEFAKDPDTYVLMVNPKAILK